jgi:hypothetical protein
MSIVRTQDLHPFQRFNLERSAGQRFLGVRGSLYPSRLPRSKLIIFFKECSTVDGDLFFSFLLVMLQC